MTINDIDFKKDYYGILGVSKNASQSDIKKAYRKLSVKYHPDKHTDDSEVDKKAAEEKFVAANEAYSILSDEKLRKAYDAGPMEGYNGFSGFGFNPFNPFGRRQKPQGPAPGQSLIVRVRVTYDEICKGINNKILKYKRMVRCEHCHGKGGEDVHTCERCHGTGVIINEQRVPGQIIRQQFTCPECNGKGTIVSKECNHCNGTGLIQKTEKYNLSLSTENLIQNHARVFVGYYGNESTDENGRDGELIFEIVHDLPDTTQIGLLNNGWSIVEEIKVPYYDMLLGTKILVHTPSDKKIYINVPECSSEGTQLRAKGQGFDIPGYEKGDYIVVVYNDDIDELTEGERKLLKKLKKEHESR